MISFARIILCLFLTVDSFCLAFFSSDTFCQKRRKSLIRREESDYDYYQPSAPPSRTYFSLDPTSENAKDILQKHLGLTQTQHDQLTNLAELVVEWNQNINLVSRKECTVEVVFSRHVLPSLALLSMNSLEDGFRVVDVGTGGGFPGLPLAIAYPEIEFLLVDSVGKKLKVIDEMAKSLSLDNVKTYHGRAEEMVDINETKHRNAYDVCVGRSVASIPKFCFWIQDLLRLEDESKAGKLMYIIGGDIDDDILSRTDAAPAIDDLMEQDGVSDKRILVLSQSQVKTIASESGEKKRNRNFLKAAKSAAKSSSTPDGNRSNKKVRGAWKKRDSSVPKQRGYENFKRYGSY